MPTTNYQDDLLKRLQSSRYAAQYLRVAFEEGDERVFLLALKNVVTAAGGVTEVAARSDISRQHLHRVLSGKGNPTLVTLKSILKAVSVKLDFIPQSGSKSRIA